MAKINSAKGQRNPPKNLVTEILKKPYTRILTPDEESGTYTAQILEFPGCIEQGDTPNEAYANLEKAANGWVKTAIGLGQEIPEPFLNQGFGGKIALRLPRSIHRRAALMAERDNTSLNQFLLAAISERVGAENLYARIVERFVQVQTFATINVIKADLWATVWKTSPQIIPNPIETAPQAILPQSPSPQQLSEGNQQHA